MNTRALYYLGAGIGGTIGSFVPLLWGASELSGWSIVLSGIGGIAGLWVAYKLVHNYG